MTSSSVRLRGARLFALALLYSTNLPAQSGGRAFWEVAVPLSTAIAWETGRASVGASLVGGVRVGSRAEIGAIAEWQGLSVDCIGPCGEVVGNDPPSQGLSRVERIGVTSRVFLRSHPRLRGAYAMFGAALMHGTWKDEARPSVMTPAYSLGVGWRSRSAFSLDLEVVDWVKSRAGPAADWVHGYFGLDRGFFEITARWRLP